MMLKIIIILLAADDEGITLKLHLLRGTFSQVRNQEFEMGVDCFGGVTPNWDSLYFELECFFV